MSITRAEGVEIPSRPYCLFLRRAVHEPFMLSWKGSAAIVLEDILLTEIQRFPFGRCEYILYPHMSTPGCEEAGRFF
jgi:hypothetical protein